MLSSNDAAIFENSRPKLLGLAYRILGSTADAEDAVQDTFLRWAKTDRDEVKSPASWLTTTCTRRCLDLLRSAHRSRVTYVGEWLPEPVQSPIDNEAESSLELAASLKTAFLLVLERLTPRERAAYLLHDIFDVPYSEIAETLDMRESACRKLVSRAKVNIDQAKTRHITPLDRQTELLTAFRDAIKDGETGRLEALLSSDVRLTADGGGKVPTVLDVLRGKVDIAAFLTEELHGYWSGHEWEVVNINGDRGIVLRHEGDIEATVSFAYDELGYATDIFIVRNPEKLSNLNEAAIH